MIKKYNQTILCLVATALVISLVSCNPARKYEKDESQAIDSYLSTSDKDFEQKPSGLYYHEDQVGTGAMPTDNDSAYVRYTGKYLNGNTFASNVGNNQPLFGFTVGGNVIEGMGEGVTYMKQGGKSTLLIPSSLAYGTTGFSTVPGYTPLLFEIELVKVVPNVK